MKSIVVLLVATISLWMATRSSKSEEVKNSEVCFGVDVSEYQGRIDWDAVATQKSHPIEFVFVRATMGKDRKDKKFAKNWETAKRKGFLVGAYHYYDPNENSLEQAKNYLSTIALEAGDFVPVVDIERISTKQSMRRLRLGLKRWLDAVESVYGVKPIIYTGHSFASDHLLEEFKQYPFWIAAYSQERRNDHIVARSAIHQFSEKVRVPGISANLVDGNDIKRELLDSLLLKK